MKEKQDRKYWLDLLQDPAITGEEKIRIVADYLDPENDPEGNRNEMIPLFIDYLDRALAKGEVMFQALIVPVDTSYASMKTDWRKHTQSKFVPEDPARLQTKQQKENERKRFAQWKRIKKYKALLASWTTDMELERFRKPLTFLKNYLVSTENAPNRANMIKWQLTAAEFSYLFLRLEQLEWIKLPGNKSEMMRLLMEVFHVPGHVGQAKLVSLLNECIPAKNTSSPVFRRELDNLNTKTSIEAKKKQASREKRK